MRELTKAQLTIGILACFSIGLGSVQRVLVSRDVLLSVGYLALNLIAVFILCCVLLAILRWINIFDLKTDAVITLLVLVVPLLIVYSQV
ncbi:MAG: hypothetical protein V1726_06950 [Methanobacteriota archaeon]